MEKLIDRFKELIQRIRQYLKYNIEREEVFEMEKLIDRAKELIWKIRKYLEYNIKNIRKNGVFKMENGGVNWFSVISLFIGLLLLTSGFKIYDYNRNINADEPWKASWSNKKEDEIYNRVKNKYDNINEQNKEKAEKEKKEKEKYFKENRYKKTEYTYQEVSQKVSYPLRKILRVSLGHEVGIDKSFNVERGKKEDFIKYADRLEDIYDEYLTHMDTNHRQEPTDGNFLEELEDLPMEERLELLYPSRSNEDFYRNHAETTEKILKIMRLYGFPPFLEYFYDYTDEQTPVFNENVTVEGYEQWLQDNGYEILDIYKSNEKK